MSNPPDEIRDLAEMSELIFKKLVLNIYDEPINETRELVDQWSKEGIASTRKFLERIANRVWEKFKFVEAAFEEAYILPIEKAAKTETGESWIRSKIQEVVTAQVARAQTATSSLCSSFPAPPQQYAMYSTRLQGECDLMTKRFAESVRLSILRIRQLQRSAVSAEREQDDLLPLLRRKSFDRALLAAAASATNSNPVSLLMIDVDRFKDFNDSHGHLVGDEVLIGCATVIKERSLHKGDAYRYGGEEMVVLLQNFTTAEAMALAETIRSGIESKTIAERHLSVTVSIGVATIPAHAGQAQGLLEAADQALYSAKKSGRNRVESAGTANPAPFIHAVGQREEARTEEQKKTLFDSIDLTVRLEQAHGQHIELKVENKSDVIVQVTRILLFYDGVKAAENRIETSEPGRMVKRSQKLISWIDTPGLAQAIQEIRGEFSREFDDYVEIQLRIEALGQLKDLPSQKIRVKVEPGGHRVWQIR
jgi:diguanylate cyclase (GGDEF)-like protein